MYYVVRAWKELSLAFKELISFLGEETDSDNQTILHSAKGSRDPDATGHLLSGVARRTVVASLVRDGY